MNNIIQAKPCFVQIKCVQWRTSFGCLGTPNQNPTTSRIYQQQVYTSCSPVQYQTTSRIYQQHAYIQLPYLVSNNFQNSKSNTNQNPTTSKILKAIPTRTQQLLEFLKQYQLEPNNFQNILAIVIIQSTQFLSTHIHTWKIGFTRIKRLEIMLEIFQSLPLQNIVKHIFSQVGHSSRSSVYGRSYGRNRLFGGVGVCHGPAIGLPISAQTTTGDAWREDW